MPPTDTDFEREFAELVAQLREAPTAAPDSLRARVRALGEPDAPPTPRDRLALVPWRRTVLLAAPVCVAALLSVAIVRGVVSSGSGGPRAVTSWSRRSHHDAGEGPALLRTRRTEPGFHDATGRSLLRRRRPGGPR